MLSLGIAESKGMERQNADPQQSRANKHPKGRRPVWSSHSRQCPRGRAHPIVILPASMGPAGKEVPSRIKVEEDEHVWELNQKGPW